MNKIKDITWGLMIIFFGLSIYDVRFGVLGFLCMGIAMGFAFSGSKEYCKVCPRSSLLTKLKKISRDKVAPKWILKKWVKYFILTYMMVMVIFGLVTAEKTLIGIGSVMFRVLGVSSLVAVILGIFYKPNTWCTICPITTIVSIRKKDREKK